ncbi:MAG: dockerin type I repeat-containing protein, partial [Muribaculaceae bacterium]|nr:dockerin type I repeat-containing protein [Muribaculaceae bacterium]
VLTATVTVNNLSTLSFDFKAWGEGTSYDKCIFSIDGTQQFSYGARDNDWETFTAQLTVGTHTLTWTYQKDSSVNPTGDYFAVDNVAITENGAHGDVNGDTFVTIADVSALIDILLGKGEVTAGSDVNGDTYVTIADVSALIDILLVTN